MSIVVRTYKRGGWEVDISLLLPDGTQIRERKKSPVSSKSGSKRWGEAREKQLLLNGVQQKVVNVPTLEAFSATFLEGHPVANRHKPSGIAAKETIIRVHLIPALGNKKLNQISNKDIQQLKGKLSQKAVKTVNNIISVLNTMLKMAVEWEVIDQMPCTIKLLKVPDTEAKFFDFGEYSALVKASQRLGDMFHLVVLLSGDAGLRCGEIMALEWSDISFQKRQLRVKRSEWKGHVTVPKGGKTRTVPMTSRLTQALKVHRHLIGPRVLCFSNGETLSQKVARSYVLRSCRLANLPQRGIHSLRHTFCSHLAMRGAPARSIQELAGHKNLTTTQRYMHLSPAAIEAAIKLLEQPVPTTSCGSSFGDILETGNSKKLTSTIATG